MTGKSPAMGRDLHLTPMGAGEASVSWIVVSTQLLFGEGNGERHYVLWSMPFPFEEVTWSDPVGVCQGPCPSGWCRA